ncbi:MAG: GNAT family N-acetyltransferase [Chloroflexi bacterium]|nr:GNAT family N-acetyltransferase [Chloroflexota bacterium]
MTEEMIAGEKVVLRTRRLSDAADDYRWRTDPELTQLDATTPLRMSLPDFLRYFQSELRDPSPWSKRFAIDDLEGRHIGNCMCYDIDVVKGEAELGILIGERDYWSKGYGTDAVVTLLRHIFTTMKLQRVYLHTLEWNHRARRSFEKSGFTPLRLVQRDGQTFMHMDVHKEEWLKLHPAPKPQSKGKTPSQAS